MIFILTRKKTRERERERGHDILQNVLSIKYTNRKYAHRTRCTSSYKVEEEKRERDRRTTQTSEDVQHGSLQNRRCVGMISSFWSTCDTLVLLEGKG